MPRVIPPSMNAFMGRYVIGDNAITSLVLKRGGSDLPAQNVRIAKVSQRSVDEGEAVSTGTSQVRVIGDTTLDIQQDDRFTWDSNNWVVIDPRAIGADHVSRTAIAEMRL